MNSMRPPTMAAAATPFLRATPRPPSTASSPPLEAPLDSVALRGGPSAAPATASPPATAATLPAPPPPSFLLMADGPAAVPTGGRSPESRAVAEQCHAIVFGAGTIEQKTDAITAILAPAVEAAASPDAAWVKATPAELHLFVQETLEHTAGIRNVGHLRGLDFDAHDFEGDTSKLNPEIAQFLARPGRDDSVKWAIGEHNAAPHHRLWHDPASTAADLKESATDIVNAWRMSRRTYQKPPWSWEKIQATISADFEDGRLTTVQRDALVEAIPFQKECEARFGWSG